MPSFRDGGGHEDDKTLSVIYDDTDLARDHLSNFGLGHNNYHYQQQYVTPTHQE